ncbi:MAG: ABC transporter ATP-binding protein [Pseudomonadota bacterium]|uniref:ABC transporter ATP-binding protein n=1 Tax=Thermithiobacillus tepidarius TaxID=929 RepID=UPI0004259DD1|nr:ABC transporter ATP-binding protein [Thermithiobacillus tepidarius]
MSGVLLEARGVTRVLPGPVPVTLVADVDLRIEHGEFVAITGPSGSGKSSLLYLLGLLDVPSRGAIYLEGRDTSALNRTELAALRLRKLGFVFQFHFLLPEFSALENVLIPMRKLAAQPERDMRARAARLLEELGLGAELHKKPEQLSGGQRQRVAIARALANDPLLILADEPTGNLDSKNGQIVFDIFQRLVRDNGQTVITVTHDPQLSQQTQRQIRLVDGRVVE